MAEAGYGCEYGDCMLQFRFMITDISNGNTITLCEEHYPPGLIPILASELGVDPGDFYTYVERYLKRQAAKAEKDLASAQAASTAKSSQAPAASPSGGQADDDDDGQADQASQGQAAAIGGDAA